MERIKIKNPKTGNDFKGIITSAANKLKHKLNMLDLSKTESQVDDFYMNRYLYPKIRSLDTQLAKYSYHLMWVFSLLREQGLSPKDSVFVDHGGGTGLFGMLAKEAGIGTVIYNDIDDKFLQIAKTISEAVGLAYDHYVLGDIDELVSYVRKRDINCNVIASYDVIEHIYDMEDFFKQIPSLSNGSLGLIMSSGANLYNPRYVLKIIPKQKAVEKEYFKQRRDIIKSSYPELSKRETNLLAKRTRGLRKGDVEMFVYNYKKHNIIKREQHRTNSFDPFKTNTCIPETGYWAEHFMNPFALKRILEENGFKCDVKTGKYHGKNYRLIRNALNTLLRYGGILGFPIAPYYSIIAIRS